jgi:hypothetical protein
MLFQDCLIPDNTQRVGLEFWNRADLLTMGRRCLEVICIFRYPVREKIEDLILPTGLRDALMYDNIFASPDVQVTHQHTA